MIIKLLIDICHQNTMPSINDNNYYYCIRKVPSSCHSPAINLQCLFCSSHTVLCTAIMSSYIIFISLTVFVQIIAGLLLTNLCNPQCSRQYFLIIIFLPFKIPLTLALIFSLSALTCTVTFIRLFKTFFLRESLPNLSVSYSELF